MAIARFREGNKLLMVLGYKAVIYEIVIFLVFLRWPRPPGRMRDDPLKFGGKFANEMKGDG